MTFDHTPDAVEKEMESHPGTLVAWIGIGTVALIVGIIMLAQLAVGMWGGRSLENDPAMKPEALAARIAPVAKLQLDGAAAVAPAPQGAKVATVAAAPAAAGWPEHRRAPHAPSTAAPAATATGKRAPRLSGRMP